MALAAVRAATPADAVEIARIQADTWAAAYSALVPAAAIDALRGPDAREAWAAAAATGAVLVATEGEWTVGFVAAGGASPPEEGGGTAAAAAASEEPPAAGTAGSTTASSTTAGSATAGGATPDSTTGDSTTASSTTADSTAAARLGPGAWGEVGVLLVEPRWGRRGHGGRLLAAAAARLRETGALFGLAWVPEADTASLRFYARAGWEPDGAVRGLDTGEAVLHEVRVTGPLDLRLTG